MAKIKRLAEETWTVLNQVEKPLCNLCGNWPADFSNEEGTVFICDVCKECVVSAE